jgi:hypothetical protein
MREVFEDDGQYTEDPAWIAYCGQQGLAAFSKDEKARTVHVMEFRAHKVNLFLLPDQKMSGPEQIDRYVTNRYKIAQRAQKRGPQAYLVRAGKLDKVGFP